MPEPPLSETLREYLACKGVTRGIDELVQARFHLAGAGTTQERADGVLRVDAALTALDSLVDGVIRTYIEKPELETRAMNHHYNLVLQNGDPATYAAEVKKPKRQYPHTMTFEGRMFTFTVERHRHALKREVGRHFVIDALKRALVNKQDQAKVADTDGQVTVHVIPSADATARKPHFTKEGAVLSDGRFVTWLDLRDTLLLMMDKGEQSNLPLTKHEVLSRDVDEPVCEVLQVMRRFARFHGAE